MKAIGVALIAFVLTWPVAALSQQPKPQPKPQSQQPSQPLMSGDGWRLVRSVQLGTTGKYIHMVLIDAKRDADKAVYGSALRSLCRSEPDFCRVRFWNAARNVPETVTFTESQFKTLRAEYILNRAGGIEELRYACTVAPDNKQCFSH